MIPRTLRKGKTFARAELAPMSSTVARYESVTTPGMLCLNFFLRLHQWAMGSIGKVFLSSATLGLLEIHYHPKHGQRDLLSRGGTLVTPDRAKPGQRRLGTKRPNCEPAVTRSEER